MTTNIREIFDLVKSVGPAWDFDRVCVREEAELDFIPRRSPPVRPFSAILPVLGVPVVVDETMPARVIELRLGDEVVHRINNSSLNPAEWTPEQKENVMKYGLCLCGQPREARLEKTEDEWHYGLVCPEGHPQ